MSTQSLQPYLAAWNTATGQEVRMAPMERTLWELQRMEYGPEDITLVVRYLQRFNAKSTAQYRMHFHKVLEPEFFASVHGDAKAQERNRRPKPTAAQVALGELRPLLVDPDELPQKDRKTHISDVLKSLGGN